MITYNNQQKINDASSATQVGIFVSNFPIICNILFRILMGHKFKEQTLKFKLPLKKTITTTFLLLLFNV